MRKMGLEEWSALYNRPRYRYAGSANQSTPRRRGGAWSDILRMTDKGMEGQQGDTYYFDEDGNVVSVATGRKGHINLDETYVTPLQTYTVDKDGNKTMGRDPLRVSRNDKPLERVYPEFALLNGYKVADMVRREGLYSVKDFANYTKEFINNPYINAAATSYGVAHGINDVRNGNANWTTALDFVPLGWGAYKYAPQLYQYGKNTYSSVGRTLQDYADRYNAMLNAQAYKATTKRYNKLFLTAYDRAAYNWDSKYGDMPIDNTGNMLLFNNSYKNGNGKFYNMYGAGKGSVTAEPEGNMTITTHLGGKPKENAINIFDVENMDRSAKAWAYRFLSGAPKGTYLGERGRTLNYAEQYFNTKPSRLRAISDALKGKKVNNPNWVEEEQSLARMLGDPKISRADKNEYKRLIAENMPHSMDSYEQMILLDKNGKFDLGYDSTPMGMFNNQGNHNAELLNYIKGLPKEEQVKAINDWIKSLGNPRARLAYIENGKVQIPRTLLITKK